MELINQINPKYTEFCRMEFMFIIANNLHIHYIIVNYLTNKV